jgi:hypothetical protein
MGPHRVIYLLPLCLGQMQGYNAFEIGTVISGRGFRNS